MKNRNSTQNDAKLASCFTIFCRKKVNNVLCIKLFSYSVIKLEKSKFHSKWCQIGVVLHKFLQKNGEIAIEIEDLWTWSWPKSNQTWTTSGKTVAPLEISQTDAPTSKSEYNATTAPATATNLYSKKNQRIWTPEN